MKRCNSRGLSVCSVTTEDEGSSPECRAARASFLQPGRPGDRPARSRPLRDRARLGEGVVVPDFILIPPVLLELLPHTDLPEHDVSSPAERNQRRPRQEETERRRIKRFMYRVRRTLCQGRKGGLVPPRDETRFQFVMVFGRVGYTGVQAEIPRAVSPRRCGPVFRFPPRRPVLLAFTPVSARGEHRNLGGLRQLCRFSDSSWDSGKVKPVAIPWHHYTRSPEPVILSTC